MTIASRWQKISEQIAHLANGCDITVIAVSKRQTTSSIKQAYAAGARHFGESYLQEAIDKIKQLQSVNDINWHFIGPLQSNKTRDIAAHFQWVQSVSRTKIAQRLNDQRAETLPALNVLLQVNISADPAKSGLKPAEINSLATTVMRLPRLKLRGIMCIPAKTDDQHQLTEDFKHMFNIYQQLQQQYSCVDTLSMGMSSDYLQAVANGANMVRIGSALFGPRKS